MAKRAATTAEDAGLAPPSPAVAPEDISVGVLYPGNRVEKMAEPLAQSRMDVAIEPDDAYERDIVVADNADRDLGREVLKKRLHDASLVYRLRGDVFHELELWDMHPIKHWAARNVVLKNVDGVVAVSDRLAAKFQRETGISPVGSAGLWKRVGEWPDGEHVAGTLDICTLTNANYWLKVRPIAEWAPVVDEVLADIGGQWDVCGDGDHADRLADELAPYDHVQFAGYVDARERLGEANLMLHPSELDGQPNSVLEGMASKLPVVTNDFAAFTQFGGPIDTVATLDGLASTLWAYADPDERELAGQRNREYVATHHTPEAIARDYERYFGTLVAE